MKRLTLHLFEWAAMLFVAALLALCFILPRLGMAILMGAFTPGRR